ncbi:MAG: pilus assembly protein PilM [Saccharofermentanales bacterium]
MAVKQKKLVGIEIGTRNVKMVLVNGKGRISKYTYIDLPDNIILNGVIESKTMLTEVLRNARKSLGTSYRKCALCISSPDIIIRYITLPIMEEKHLISNIKTEIAGFLPDEPENYVIDFVIADKIETDEKKQYQVLVYAAPTRVLKEYADCIKAAGFKLVYLDIMENAYEKLFKMLKIKNLTRTSNFACVYIDNSRVSVSVYGNNRFFINKIVDNAMSTIYEDISLKTNKTPEQVRKQLFTDDILTYSEENVIEKSVLENYIREISNEISRVIDYYRSRNQDDPIEAVYFTGGFTHIIGIQEYIGNILGIPTINTARFLDGMFLDPPKKNNGIDYTNAIAITLREEA